MKASSTKESTISSVSYLPSQLQTEMSPVLRPRLVEGWSLSRFLSRTAKSIFSFLLHDQDRLSAVLLVQMPQYHPLNFHSTSCSTLHVFALDVTCREPCPPLTLLHRDIHTHSRSPRPKMRSRRAMTSGWRVRLDILTVKVSY
jgi:hypothetical protein